MGKIDVVAASGVFKVKVKGLVLLLTPVRDLERYVEVRRAEDQKVVAEQFLVVLSVADDDAHVTRATAQLTCGRKC